MLIAQGPLRVSLFGGGSDLPAFLERHDGAVLSFAIDRRVFIAGHPFTHRNGILLKYSKTEDVASADLLQHPIARVVLSRYGITDIDIAVMADVPAGTGLGSSSSFTVAFLAFVRHMCGLSSTATDLAREACEIEIEVLQEPIGYQDQWASALGGINVIRFSGTEVTPSPVTVGADALAGLERNLQLVPVGKPRSAGSLLRRQGVENTKGSRTEQLTAKLVDLVDLGEQALKGSIDEIGPLLHEAWMLKREIAAGVTNTEIDDLYAAGQEAGATGGKLLGAGGSGYMAFYVPESHHEAFGAQFPRRLDYRIAEQGAGIIHES